MAFIKLIVDGLEFALPTGKAIMSVSETAFQGGPNTEWAKFQSSPHQWLYNHNYRYVGLDNKPIGDGRIPADIRIVPVYDEPKLMHVRIPWKETLKQAATVAVDEEPDYQGQFPALLAHYFMRSCR